MNILQWGDRSIWMWKKRCLWKGRNMCVCGDMDTECWFWSFFRSWSFWGFLSWFWFQVICLFVCCYQTWKSFLRRGLPPWEGRTPGSLSTRARVVTPSVLPKVHRRPETLYVPTEVNTPQVDGLARTSGLTEVLYKLHPNIFPTVTCDVWSP